MAIQSAKPFQSLMDQPQRQPSIERKAFASNLDKEPGIERGFDKGNFRAAGLSREDASGLRERIQNAKRLERGYRRDYRTALRQGKPVGEILKTMDDLGLSSGGIRQAGSLERRVYDQFDQRKKSLDEARGQNGSVSDPQVPANLGIPFLSDALGSADTLVNSSFANKELDSRNRATLSGAFGEPARQSLMARINQGSQTAPQDQPAPSAQDDQRTPQASGLSGIANQIKNGLLGFLNPQSQTAPAFVGPPQPDQNRFGGDQELQSLMDRIQAPGGNQEGQTNEQKYMASANDAGALRAQEIQAHAVGLAKSDADMLSAKDKRLAESQSKLEIEKIRLDADLKKRLDFRNEWFDKVYRQPTTPHDGPIGGVRSMLMRKLSGGLKMGPQDASSSPSLIDPKAPMPESPYTGRINGSVEDILDHASWVFDPHQKYQLGPPVESRESLPLRQQNVSPDYDVDSSITPPPPDLKKVDLTGPIEEPGNPETKQFKASVADWMVNGAAQVGPKINEAFSSAVDSLGKAAKNGFAAVSVTPQNSAGSKAIPMEEIQSGSPKSAQGGLSKKPGLPTPTTKVSANFGSEKPSDHAKNTADWVLGNQDNGGKPFAIADKKSGKMHFFGQDGKLIESVPALFGRVPGDEGGKHQTSAGRYDASIYKSQDYDGDTIEFDRVKNKSGGVNRSLIHRVPFSSLTASPKQRYAALSSSDPGDNRQTSGCINLDPKASKRLTPHFKDGGVVYVMPETEQGAKKFKGFSGLKFDSSTAKR